MQARELWAEGRSTELIDPLLPKEEHHIAEITRCIQIGLLCIERNRDDRPSMWDVLLMLSCESGSLRAPSTKPTMRKKHYGRRALCRVLGALPSAETQALGKEAVCRVPHSAKPALGKGRLCRVPNTRQRGTLGKRPLCRVSGTRQRITLGKIPQATPMAPPSSFAECCKPGTRQRGSFAECQFRHSAKYFYFIFIFVFKFFLWHLYSTLKHMFQFGTFL